MHVKDKETGKSIKFVDSKKNRAKADKKKAKAQK